MISLRKLFGFFTFPILVLLFHVLVISFTDFYRIFPWFDVLMHFAGGIAVGYSFIKILDYSQKEGFVQLNRAARIIFVISLVALTAVLWEFFEFSLTYITKMSFQGNFADTILDLFLGITGGIFVSFLKEL